MRRIQDDYDRFGREGLPPAIEDYLRETYGVDVASRYGGRPIRNPFGKASGQLSMALHQVRADAEAPLGFVVLKTVIAEDESGHRMMQEWAIKETRMHLEPIAGKRVGELGWTVTWKGRGWHDTFAAYLEFVRAALAVATETGLVVAPSVKYHLPGPGEAEWKVTEYRHTTAALLRVWEEGGIAGPMILEKDFSPTLAGDQRARDQARILEWMRVCPRLIRESAAGTPLTLGLKVMNTTYDDAFQWEVLRAAAAAGADFLVYANRLFDPRREFDGKVGVAYGGPDLSARNLTLLTQLRLAEARGELAAPVPPISGTGNVTTGRMAVEYALRGVENLQMHTIFQLPDIYYGMRAPVGKSQKALHHLFLHPVTGLVPWMLYLRQEWGLGSVISFRDLVRWHTTPDGQAALARLGGVDVPR